MSTEAAKKSGPPQIVTSNKAFRLVIILFFALSVMYEEILGCSADGDNVFSTCLLL